MTDWINKFPTLSRPLDGAKLRVISLGAGVQSSTMALMASRGEIGPMPDLALFADTGDELQRTYEYLDYLETQLRFPIVRVRRPGPSLGELTLGVVDGTKPRAGSPIPPFYLVEGQERSMLPKQCSKEYKTRPVAKEIARLLGIKPGGRGPKEPTVEMWIGMSMDEIVRVATNEKKWIHNRHPLVELGMNRRDCVRWCEERQYRVPLKSSCYYCPFRDNAAWEDMAANQPEDFEKACRFDEAVRKGWPEMGGEMFVHRRFHPLRDVSLKEPDPQLNFLTDCDHCGS